MKIEEACTKLHVQLNALPYVKTSRLSLERIRYTLPMTEISALWEGEKQYTTGEFEVVVAFKYYYVQFNRVSDDHIVMLEACDESDSEEAIATMTERLLGEVKALNALHGSKDATCQVFCPEHGLSKVNLLVTAKYAY